MATNPNPARITDAMWRLWEESVSAMPGVRLSGIYANKRCYHNTVEANTKSWPTAYCIKMSLDLQGPTDKARAIDWTLSTAEMIKRTRYLIQAADRNDPRLAAVREFYGTLDGKTVVGRIKDSRTGKWRVATADLTHLWHIHMSFFTAFVAIWNELRPVLSVLRGETLAHWHTRSIMFCVHGDSGEHVRYLQYQLTHVGYSPGKVDGRYGDATAAALSKAMKSLGHTNDGKSYDADEKIGLDGMWSRKFAGESPVVKELVAQVSSLTEQLARLSLQPPAVGGELPSAIRVSGTLNIMPDAA